MRNAGRGGAALAATTLLFLTWGAGRADADLVLTQDAVNLGFSPPTTFASDFPTAYGIGPLGIAFPTGGGVLVSDYPGNVRLFPSASDGQLASTPTVIVGQNYGVSNAVGLTQLGGNIYMTQQGRGAVVQLNPDGTRNRDVVVGLAAATGIVANPANGHLYVSTSGDGAKAVFDVDPVAGTKALFASTPLDGLTISPDGKTLYGATAGNDRLLGFNTSTGAVVFDSDPIAGGVDGAALGTGTLAGNIFVNTTNGTVVEVNLATLQQTLIATGGSRGDFVTVAPDGSLLLTQTDSIVRLTAPPGGGFSTPQVGDPPPVPEPSTLVLLGLGAAALAGWRWRRRRAPGAA